jgi:uncharacterized protein
MYMKHRQNPVFELYKKALDWFESDLQIVLPQSRPESLAFLLDKIAQFKVFAEVCMQTFETGVDGIRVETIPIEDFLGPDNKAEAEKITAELRANPGNIMGYPNDIEHVDFVWEDGRANAKRVVLTHKEDKGKSTFILPEESDGTRRLLEYLPMLYMAIFSSKVCIIDEIERSLHPLIIKELIRKFSEDQSTKGQLIFSTHESNLLDQEIFRPDEIWFAEKNKLGATELYPLSEFKEHHTLDIRKGYLNGRYGGIPFLGNLKDLNWDQYAEATAV